MTPDVTSTRNPRVMWAAKLHTSKARKAEGLTIIEGPHLLSAAIAGGASINTIFALDDDDAAIGVAVGAGIDPITVTHQVMARLSGTLHPRGPVAVIAIPESSELTATDSLVLCDISDPGNTGTLIRTAEALGLDVVISGTTSDPWAPKVLRAAAGAHFRTPLAVVNGDLVAALRGAGLVVVATVPRDGEDPETVLSAQDPMALLIGSEAHGLEPGVVAAADERISLRMPGGAESLNAAIAGSIVAYLRSQRRP